MSQSFSSKSASSLSNWPVPCGVQAANWRKRRVHKVIIIVHPLVRTSTAFLYFYLFHGGHQKSASCACVRARLSLSFLCSLIRQRAAQASWDTNNKAWASQNKSIFFSLGCQPPNKEGYLLSKDLTKKLHCLKTTMWQRNWQKSWFAMI